jgi:hypothetical protein
MLPVRSPLLLLLLLVLVLLLVLPLLPLLLLLLLLLLQVNNKKTTFKVNYLTATKGINGEVISQLAPNKKATVAFNDKQVRVCLIYYLIAGIGLGAPYVVSMYIFPAPRIRSSISLWCA